MNRFPGKQWKQHVLNRVRPRFEQFGDLVLSRVLPAFDGINEEATALEKRRRAEMVSSLDVPDEDIWDAREAIGELAFNEAMDYAVSLSSMQFATVNLFSAALYHLTEQHLVDLCLQILNRDDRVEVRQHQAVAWFNDRLGLDLKTLLSWPLIDELRLVANTLKHGEGRNAAEGLRKVRLDLFVYLGLEVGGDGPRKIRMGTPLFGHDLFVTQEDFVRYHKGSVSFWTELAERLPECKWVSDET